MTTFGISFFKSDEVKSTSSSLGMPSAMPSFIKMVGDDALFPISDIYKPSEQAKNTSIGINTLNEFNEEFSNIESSTYLYVQIQYLKRQGASEQEIQKLELQLEEVDKRAEELYPSPRAGRASGRGLLTIFDTPQIVLVLLLAFVSYTGLAFHSAFLGKYCVELGYGQGLVGVVSATSAMSEVPILLVSDRLVRRFGVLPLLKFACVAMAVRLVLVGSGVVPLMVGAQLLQSVSYMTVYYSTVTYIQQHAVPGAEARAQGVLVAVQAGLATVVANFLGGIVCDAVGTAMGYLVAAAVTLAAGLAVALVSGRTAHAATA